METVIRKEIFKTLPASVTVLGDTILFTPNWQDELPNPLPTPAFLAHLMPGIDLSASDQSEDVSEVTDTVTGETHTFTAGDTYTVLDQMDVDTVTSVTGTAGGNAYTFVADTDYKLSDSDGDGAKDALEWLSGGTKPDTGTTVTVTYEQKLLERTRSHVFASKITIRMVAGRLKNGERGASQAIRPAQILEAGRQAIIQWYEKDFRPAIEALGVGTGPRMDDSGTSPVRNAAGLFQRALSVPIEYQEDVTMDRVEYARKITTTENVKTP